MKSGHKMHHHRKGRAEGGKMDSPASGSREWEEDEKTKPMSYTASNKVTGEAEEKKRGGRAKKMVGKVKGVMAKCHAGRKPRKAGGRAGSDRNPLSSAHAGTEPKGHKDNEID